MSIRRVGLFCNARDELRIKEWAAHHLLIGFDVVVIYDHKSMVPLKDRLKNFSKKVITLRVNKGDQIKMPLMNDAIKVARKLGLDWFIYLDADEFIILNNQFIGIKDFLSKYPHADSVGLNWVFFGTNGHVNDPPGLIFEEFTKSEPKLNDHVKSLVRTREVVHADNPHFYHIRNPAKMVGILSNCIQGEKALSRIDMKFEDAPAYIAHHVYQSEETCIRRKVRLRRDDDGTFRGNMGKEIHNSFNNVINNQALKYVREIKAFLLHYKK